MSQTTDQVPLRAKLRVEISNILQKYRSLLLGLVAAAILVVISLAIWTQVDAATKADYAAKIEKSQGDYTSWKTEADATKKADLGKALEAELVGIEKSAPTGYGLSKAWFLHGNFLGAQKNWAEAAKAFHTVYDKDSSSYLAPIALVNAAVSQEEAGDASAAMATYAEFERKFSADGLLAPQVFFSEGRLLELQQKLPEAVVAYKKLIEKFPESNWTKLGRDRILLLSQD